MADVYSCNKQPPAGAATTDYFSAQWWLLKCAMKAGWLLKGSSDATTKSASADPMLQKWALPVAVGGQTGAVASIGAMTGKDYTLTGLTGLVAPTNTNQGGSEGRLLVISGAASTGNNVTWLITKYISTTSCLARPLVTSAVNHSAGTGPVMTISGHLCRTTRVNIYVKAANNGNTIASGLAQVQIGLAGSGGAFAAAVVIPATGIVEVIDENGVHTGIYLIFAAGTVVTADVWQAPGAVATDANNGAITWTEYDPLTAVYAAMASGAWILLEGPMTLKIPFGAAPVGTFFRGENIVQATTGAEGEVLGVTYEPSTGVGYLVVMPRLQGTGIDPEGWNHANQITGSTSGATVTPNAICKRYVRQMMVSRGTGVTGTITYQCVDDSAETASALARLMQEAGCTNTIPPGQGGTGNAFPGATTGSYCVWGTAGSVTHDTNPWVNDVQVTTNTIGNLQTFVANCIERTNVSQDGSWTQVVGEPVVSVTFSGGPSSFMRCDGGEEGDVEPYVWLGGINTTNQPSGINTRARTGQGNGAVHVNSRWAANGCFGLGGGANNCGVSWKKRGLGGAGAAAEGFAEVSGAVDATDVGAAAIFVIGNAATTDQEKVMSTGLTTAPIVIEFPRMVNPTSQLKVRKGAVRHIGLIQGNVGFDTFGTKAWLQPGDAPGATMASIPCVVRWDGSTVPVQ